MKNFKEVLRSKVSLYGIVVALLTVLALYLIWTTGFFAPF